MVCPLIYQITQMAGLMPYLCLVWFPGSIIPYSPILQIIKFHYQNISLQQYSKGPMKIDDTVASFQMQFILGSPDKLLSWSSILLGSGCVKRDDETRNLEWTLVILTLWK